MARLYAEVVRARRRDRGAAHWIPRIPLAEGLVHDAPGTQAVGGGEGELALIAAAAIAEQGAEQLGADGVVIDLGQGAAAGDQAVAAWLRADGT